jgi:hypothetical protein
LELMLTSHAEVASATPTAALTATTNAIAVARPDVISAKTTAPGARLFMATHRCTTLRIGPKWRRV